MSILARYLRYCCWAWHTFHAKLRIPKRWHWQGWKNKSSTFPWAYKVHIVAFLFSPQPNESCPSPLNTMDTCRLPFRYQLSLSLALRFCNISTPIPDTQCHRNNGSHHVPNCRTYVYFFMRMIQLGVFPHFNDPCQHVYCNPHPPWAIDGDHGMSLPAKHKTIEQDQPTVSQSDKHRIKHDMTPAARWHAVAGTRVSERWGRILTRLQMTQLTECRLSECNLACHSESGPSAWLKKSSESDGSASGTQQLHVK